MLVFYFFFQTVYCITGKLARYVYEILWISIIVIQDCYILWIYHLFLFQTEYIVILCHWKIGWICVPNCLNFNYCDPILLYLMNILSERKLVIYFCFKLYIVSLENWLDMCIKLFEFQLFWSNIFILIHTHIIKKFWMLKCTFFFFLIVYTCWLIIDWSDLESESSNFDE